MISTTCNIHLREWGYLQRAVPQCGPAFSPIEEAIAKSFLPELFGSKVSPAERKLCQLPVKITGLGVADPSTSSAVAHEVSRKATVHLANAIAGKEEFELAKHSESVLTARMVARSQHEAELLPLFEASPVSVLGEQAQRGLRRAKEFSTGARLVCFAEREKRHCSFRPGVQGRPRNAVQQAPTPAPGIV